MGKGSESHGGEGGGERGEGGGECKRASPSRTHTMQWPRSEWCGRCGCVSLVHATTLLHEREQLDSQQRSEPAAKQENVRILPGWFLFHLNPRPEIVPREFSFALSPVSSLPPFAPPDRPRLAAMPGKWALDDSTAVWNDLGHVQLQADGELPNTAEVNAIVARLAKQFGRTDGAIRSRIRHMHDTSHAAYTELVSCGARQPATNSAPPPPPRPAAPPQTAAGDQADSLLLAALRSFRAKRAQADKVEPYHVLHNSVLQKIADRCPTSLDELKIINGLGMDKMNKYGSEIVRICQESAPARPAAPPGPLPHGATTTPCGKRKTPATGSGTATGGTVAVAKRPSWRPHATSPAPKPGIP